MPPDIHDEVYEGLGEESRERLAFTRRAFELLPPMDRPLILDAGCGRGVPARELASLSGGEVIGVDIDEVPLQACAAAVAAAVAAAADRNDRSLGRVRLIRCSVRALPFPRDSFDLIWAEASMHVIGWETCLAEWRDYLKTGGFLVMHEVVWLKPDPPAEASYSAWSTLPEAATPDWFKERIPPHGYEVIDHFSLPEDFWWHEYYAPLEERIRRLKEKYAGDQAACDTLDREQAEVDLYRRNAAWCGSAFFVMRKV